ncbi:MAG TPA: divergent polysaccharide deacetylase family protein [Pedomonas sp.]|uniref:divergent polysaccharide deacetylase family protein n=1 Tax=Pedomonas sp. TaxID=2976421 RepID=UPI002F3E72F1
MRAGPDDDFPDDETHRRPLWQWLLAGAVGLFIFIGLAVGFTGLLTTHVRHVPASAVLADLPHAEPIRSGSQTPEIAQSQARAADVTEAAEAALPDPGASASAPASVSTSAPAPAPVPASVIPAGPKIVLLLADAGANPALTRKAIDQLPPQVAFGFNPYPKDLPALVAAARERGHEIWLGIPMEPLRYPQVNPGPQALLLNSAPERNLKRLEWVLNRIDGEVGVYSIMGSAFTTREAALHPVLAAVHGKGLPFFDSRASGKTQSRAIAKTLGLPLLVNDSFVGSPVTAQAIAEQLATLERLARSRGVAVGVIEPSSLVLEQLAAWLPQLAGKKISLVPPRALLDAQGSAAR